MGTLIPLFNRKRTPTKAPLTPEQALRVKLLTNSLEALKREERAIEEAITTKCRDEIERLNAIDSQMHKLKSELEELSGLPWPGPSCSKG
ncbi:MAG: hypothetical protein OZSIB_1837 [Candidatus Ozemobacter sibiricus]|jgi:hypothetical protein|uniref:Uncharacterized protein n=1 Tax=Candidatus Ozemobacter sibiricus TaxID=2268124 RepID=A0A367ZL06_9BACT|nr:MAG: hypothetical protein OZSIB_1837 [Candidatus Ozemobacter sibiricus]